MGRIRKIGSAHCNYSQILYQFLTFTQNLKRSLCIIIRYLLKPFIYAKLQMNNYYGDIITEYLTNYMCFIVLSVEIFSILFTFGVVKSVVVLLFVDTAIFIGLLVVGLVKMDLRGKEVL